MKAKSNNEVLKRIFTFFSFKTQSLFLLFAFFVFFSEAIAQTNEQLQYIKTKTNVAALQQLSAVSGGNARARRLLAEQWSVTNGIAISGINERGQEFLLQDYDPLSQTPFYIATTNVNSSKTISTDQLLSTGSSGFNLSGSQITITMWDGGKVCDQHPEYINRGISGIYETTIEPVSSHATHVAGTLIAEGVDYNARGMAPAANIVYYGFNDWNIEIPLEAANGYVLSNNSWGELSQGWSYLGGIGIGLIIWMQQSILDLVCIPHLHNCMTYGQIMLPIF
jgi:hypothetical protein